MITAWIGVKQDILDRMGVKRSWIRADQITAVEESDGALTLRTATGQTYTHCEPVSAEDFLRDLVAALEDGA